MVTVAVTVELVVETQLVVPLLSDTAICASVSVSGAAAAFPLLRTPVGRAAARRILFGDRSFPDPDGPGDRRGTRRAERTGAI